MKRGKAKVGEKTFLDGLDPAVEAIKASLDVGDELVEVAAKAVSASEEGFQKATTMRAIHGRAATHDEASRDIEDPGAAVVLLMMKAFQKSVESS